MDLTGKTILVTGAGGNGVGSGICAAVTAAGGRLIVNDVSEPDAVRAAGAHGAEAAYAADVADEAQVEALFAEVSERFGPLDGLVNNAGVGLNRHVSELEDAEYQRLLDVDLRGVLLTCRAFARQPPSQGAGGSIVNVSSVHAHSTMAGYAVYAAAKAGVEGLTRGVAVDLGPLGIRCNAVAPGYVHSLQNIALIGSWTSDPEGWVRDHTVNQQAIEREIEPIDCGWAVAFLLSEQSRAITGQVLRVDAGATALLYNKDFR